jgi:hypothetical protein
MSHMIAELLDAAQGFPSSSVAGLLRSAPDLEPLVGYIESLYYIPESGKLVQTLRHSQLMEQKRQSRFYLMKGQMLNAINVLLKSRN